MTLGLNDATRAPFFSTISIADLDGQSIIYNPYANESLESWLDGQNQATSALLNNTTGVWIAIEGGQASTAVI